MPELLSPQGHAQELGQSELLSFEGSAAQSVGRMVLKHEQYESSDYTPHSQEIAEMNPRLSRLFAPRHTDHRVPEDTQSDIQGDDYERLFNISDEEAEASSGAYINSVSNSWKDSKLAPEPTERSLLDAAIMLDTAVGADPVIKSIIDSYTEPGKKPAELIRTNPELRYALGSYLLEEKYTKIMQEAPLTMPDRVAMNGIKKTNYPGYGDVANMSSSEYSVLLALAMLDGSYINPESSDPIVKSSDGRVSIGQHRSAAMHLLTYDSRNYL